MVAQNYIAQTKTVVMHLNSDFTANDSTISRICFIHLGDYQ